MDEATRQNLVQQIGAAMSGISEYCYHAGWLSGTEYTVPELCRRAAESGMTQYWGHGTITPDQARALIALSNAAGSWADLDHPGIGYEPFESFPVPPEYAEAIDREQAIRNAHLQG